MRHLRAGAVVAGVLMGTSLSNDVSAQTLGTFRWQFAPFCNTVTLRIEQHGATFGLEGFDDMCGGPKRAGATGTAHQNPDGSIGLAITVVRPDGITVHHAATVTLAALSGTWTDDFGNAGTFAFNAPSPAPGLERPATVRGNYAQFYKPSATNDFRALPLNFGLAFSSPLTAIVRPIGAAPTAECPGSSSNPQAAPGHLCVYERYRLNVWGSIAVCNVINATCGTTDRHGAILEVYVEVAGTHLSAQGTWAASAR
jgi:hypothetical protein